MDRELFLALSARQQKVDAEGAVYERHAAETGADSVWDHSTGGQFTPRRVREERAMAAASVGNTHPQAYDVDVTLRGPFQDQPAYGWQDGGGNITGGVLTPPFAGYEARTSVPDGGRVTFNTGHGDRNSSLDNSADPRDSIRSYQSNGGREMQQSRDSPYAGAQGVYPGLPQQPADPFTAMVGQQPAAGFEGYPSASRLAEAPDMMADAEYHARYHSEAAARTLPASPSLGQRIPGAQGVYPGLPQQPASLWPPSDEQVEQSEYPWHGQAPAANSQSLRPNVPHAGFSKASGQGRSLGPTQRDDLAMSSQSYFNPSASRPPPGPFPAQAATPQASMQAPVRPASAPRRPQPISSNLDPFPCAREQVVNQKLGDCAPEIAKLRGMIAEMAARHQVHPAELQQLLKFAENIQHASMLPIQALQQAGWPLEILAQMTYASQSVGCWEECEKDAKNAVADKEVSMTKAIEALEKLLSGRCQLNTLVQLQFPLDLGLERRTSGAIPMVSALLDRIVALVRQDPTAPAIRRFEEVLRRSASLKELQDLGIANHLSQALHDLSEMASQGYGPQGPQAFGQLAGSAAPTPEVLWQALVEGDVARVEGIIQQGGLISGKASDARGHSVLWNAVAFQQVEVAMLLLAHFPPDSLHGVDLSETHKRNGNTLLHTVSSWPNFSESGASLFSALFDRMSEATRMHVNARGQTFLHVAAGHLNFLVLRLGARHGLDQAFSIPDQSGWSVRMLLEHHLANRGIANALPPPVQTPEAPMPSWFPLGHLVPTQPGHRPPFADVAVGVEDSQRGPVRLFAHRVILSANSSQWREELSSASAQPAPSNGAEAPLAELPVDASVCRSAEVLHFALRFLYTGSLAECGFEDDGNLLLQLTRLCVKARLPPPLFAFGRNALLQRLDDPRSAPVLPALLCYASLGELRLQPAVRSLVGRRFLAMDEAWDAVDGEVRKKVLGMALADLENCVMGGQARMTS